MATKRKIDKEGRCFNEQWTKKYFFIAHAENHALCLVCQYVIKVRKEYNLRRHYVTNHPEMTQCEGVAREEKIASLERRVHCQHQGLGSYQEASEKATKISLLVSEILAKHQKPFSDGAVASEILQCFVEEACPEQRGFVNQVHLSQMTVTQQVEKLSDDVCAGLQEECDKFVMYSIAVDESCDQTDPAQLCMSIRGVDNNFQVTEEFLGLCSMKGTTGRDIFNEVTGLLARYNLPLTKLAGICTSGSPAMKSNRTNFTTLMKECMHETALDPDTFHEPVIYHCIIHQESLLNVASLLPLKLVMDKVLSTVNFIRSSGLNHRQFQTLLRDLDSEFGDVIYYCKVCWLSSCATLRRFWSLLSEIKQFMEIKGRPCPELSDNEWVNDLTFLADITGHLTELNLALQGKDHLITTMVDRITGFQAKLRLWERQIHAGTLDHFPTLKKRQNSNIAVDIGKYAGFVQNLYLQFTDRFQDFKDIDIMMDLFARPFSVDAENTQADFQMELLDLQSSSNLRANYNDKPILEFYEVYLPRHIYPNLYSHAIRVASLFGSTYLCEKLFIKLKLTESNYRSRISDSHLEECLRLATSQIRPRINNIVKQMQCQEAH